MSKILCIFPKDTTTEFLRPVYNTLCQQSNVVGLELNIVEDDNFLEKLLDATSRADCVVFLGHGTNSGLYGTIQVPLIDDKIGNIDCLKNKALILFACKSAEFIKNYRYTNALGFGFIPSSLDDVRGGKLHNIELSKLSQADLDLFRNAVVRIWVRTLAEAPVHDICRVQRHFTFYTNCEIVDMLLNHKDCAMCRTIADMLYYLKADMDYFS